MFFCPEEQIITLISSPLTTRWKEKKANICVGFGKGEGSLFSCGFLKLLRSVVGKPLVPVCVDPKEGQPCHWP